MAIKEEQPKSGKCSACGGVVIEETLSVYDPSTGPMLFGPGSKNQYREVKQFYCLNCGIQYHHLPPVNSSLEDKCS